MSANVAVSWFEIPVSDMDRATKFYATVFARELLAMDTPDGTIQALRSGDNPVGALVQSSHNQPSSSGPLIYFDAQGDMDAMLGRVEQSGGTILLPKTSIGPYGSIAQFTDTEGNRVALHTA